MLVSSSSRGTASHRALTERGLRPSGVHGTTAGERGTTAEWMGVENWPERRCSSGFAGARRCSPKGIALSRETLKTITDGTGSIAGGPNARYVGGFRTGVEREDAPAP